MTKLDELKERVRLHNENVESGSYRYKVGLDAKTLDTFIQIGEAATEVANANHSGRHNWCLCCGAWLPIGHAAECPIERIQRLTKELEK